MIPRAGGIAPPASRAATRWPCPRPKIGSFPCSRRSRADPSRMPRLLSVGHVTWDRVKDGEVLGGSVSYAAATARKLGWEAGVLTTAGADFEPERDLPGVSVFLARSPATTRFKNIYGSDGVRQQFLTGRADPIDLTPLPDEWRSPDVLFLAPVAGEVPART